MKAEALLRGWRAALEEAEVPLEPEVAETWVTLALGGPPEHAELAGLVALHARNLGESGVPAHRSVLQASLLERQVDLPSTLRLTAVAADAHVIGVVTRLERRRQRFLRDHLPVLELPSGEVLACALGPLDGELLDALLGRAFALAAGAGAGTVVLDVAGAERLDEELLRETLRAFPGHELAEKLTLVVSGLDEPERMRDRLGAASGPGAPVRIVRQLAELAGGAP